MPGRGCQKCVIYNQRGREGGEGKGGREDKGRGAYPDEGPLTKILNTPLDKEWIAVWIAELCDYAYA